MSKKSMYDHKKSYMLFSRILYRKLRGLFSHLWNSILIRLRRIFFTKKGVVALLPSVKINILIRSEMISDFCFLYIQTAFIKKNYRKIIFYIYIYFYCKGQSRNGCRNLRTVFANTIKSSHSLS